MKKPISKFLKSESYCGKAFVFLVLSCLLLFFVFLVIDKAGTESSINWEAASAIATFCAVCVALFFPIIEKHLTVSKMCRLIEIEIKENYEVIKHIHEGILFTWGQERGIESFAQTAHYVSVLNCRVWEEYRYKLGLYDPDVYEQYYKINSIIESMQVVHSQEGDNKRKHQLYKEDARDFVNEYNKLF